MQIFIAGRYSEPTWEILGVYSTAEAAENRCTRADDFVAPAVLDEDLPEETIGWPGMYYPSEG